MPYLSKHEKCIPLTAMVAGAILAITSFILLAIPGCALEQNQIRGAQAPPGAVIESATGAQTPPGAVLRSAEVEEAGDTDYGAHLDPGEYSPTGHRYGDHDPCEGHRDRPNFSGDPMWKKLCLRHWPDPIPTSECLAHLEAAWAVGDADVHPSFERPPGCLP